MNKDEINAQLNNYINYRNNIWTALLVVSSGTMAVFLNLDNKIKILLVIVGILLNILLFALYKDANKNINFYIKELTKKENKDDKY